MRPRVLPSLLIALAAGGALGGCGGDEAAAPAGLPYLEADRICAEYAGLEACAAIEAG